MHKIVLAASIMALLILEIGVYALFLTGREVFLLPINLALAAFVYGIVEYAPRFDRSTSHYYFYFVDNKVAKTYPFLPGSRRQ